MPYEFKLPDVGEGIAEGEIIKWFVKEGDNVAEEQPLVEIMTEKINVEIPSPVKGKVTKLLATEGQVVPVGQTIITIETEGRFQEQAATESKGRMEPTETRSIQEKRVVSAMKVIAAPATRKLAREMKIEISEVHGTGPEGRITDDDVRSFANLPVQTPGAKSTQEERIPLRAMRRQIAEHMVKSKRAAPHATHIDEVDLTELVSLREKMKSEFEKRNAKLTYLILIFRAVEKSLAEHPHVNASLDESKNEIVIKKHRNIGVATATDEGLVVPVVKGAERKNLYELAIEIEKLSDKARKGKLEVDEVRGGTFTITNIGALGGIASIPIINHPEVAILGVHKIVKKPVYINGQVKARDVMILSLSFDHRVLDGADAARFLNAVIEKLEEPQHLIESA